MTPPPEQTPAAAETPAEEPTPTNTEAPLEEAQLDGVTGGISVRSDTGPGGDNSENGSCNC